MRLTIILILTTTSLTVCGQRFSEKYEDYFGHSLELKDDSTFRQDWRFDLIHKWATGKWTLKDHIIHLNFINVYDTLIRTNKADSLVLSIDTISNKINEQDYLQTQLTSGGQGRHSITDRLALKNKKLFLVDSNGKFLRTRHRGIWSKKKWPSYYLKQK